MNEFEQRLSRQPLRPAPAEWREEILREARRAAVPQIGDAESAPLPNRSWLSTLNSRLSTVFWPHPKAWAGLAAIWAFVFILNFSMRDTAPAVAEKSTPPSPEVVAELKQQRLMLAELIGSTETHDADRQRLFVPKPRSGRAEIFAV